MDRAGKIKLLTDVIEGRTPKEALLQLKPVKVDWSVFTANEMRILKGIVRHNNEHGKLDIDKLSSNEIKALIKLKKTVHNDT